ncbi:MAG: AAA family ATPase, partial [Bacteroidota bacterium]
MNRSFVAVFFLVEVSDFLEISDTYKILPTCLKRLFLLLATSTEEVKTAPKIKAIMLKIPYGVSGFSDMVLGGHYYIDRTQYIEKLESFTERYIIYIRPRRFGKSLFISTLKYYYGLEHQDKFSTLFGNYYIGQHPTPLANSYFVLVFDFSRIRTDKPEHTYKDFTRNTKSAVLRFLGDYGDFFQQADRAAIEELQDPTDIMVALIDLIYIKYPTKKMYVLVDEYDHFANELLAFDFNAFTTIVGKNGFVRKFYEALKEGTRIEVIDRIFITGVLPITLDSLTSGFNMAENFSTDIELEQMMGFTLAEVMGVLQEIELKETNTEQLLKQLQFWYDGYRFSPESNQRLFNPDMIFYFCKYYARLRKYPSNLLDANIASDYTKVRNMFGINNKAKENYEVLKEIIREGTVGAQLINRLTFEREWTRNEFVSLLFFQGILSIESKNVEQLTFKMPNFVIQRLYYQYFYELSLQTTNLSMAAIDVVGKIEQFAQTNDFQPVIEHIQDILTVHAVEDRAHFNEAHVKAVFIANFYN